ncbi:hypothetical protein I0C86_31110 [Plantactinospora sp. S1510]|uniref:Uncharacterized protein n=1 Tax=Plantactinospora alkalitolerans TaxID=2789879 RepID=A0ABS0H4I9_9ACTN|nr:hypothetical protein [Plantactinospora alkalitolerans]MBF9133376.1 hypothetical protein [Plantactinospora alkalitolerans]
MSGDAFLTVEWQPLLRAGFPLRAPADEPAPVLTVEWGPMLGTSYYGYGDDLTGAEDRPGT